MIAQLAVAVQFFFKLVKVSSCWLKKDGWLDTLFESWSDVIKQWYMSTRCIKYKAMILYSAQV